MSKKKKWYGETYPEQIQLGQTFATAMAGQRQALGIPAAFVARFTARVGRVGALYAKMRLKTATGAEKNTFRTERRKMIAEMQDTRTKYLNGAALDATQWAAWGLPPRKAHASKATQIFTALLVAHQYILGVVGMVIFTFTAVGSKGWGKEDYCESFEIRFGTYYEGGYIPTTTGEIEKLPGHLIVRKGRSKLNLEAYRGMVLMVFVRMLNNFPVPGPFNDPPDFVQIT